MVMKDFDNFLRIADILLVDNAFEFDINDWEEEIQKEIDEALNETHEPVKKEFVKYNLDEDKIDAIIEKLKTSTFNIIDYWKTKQFLKKKNITKEEVETIIKNLSKEDYKFNSKSDANEAIIFVKNIAIPEKGDFKLYIKLDYDSIEKQPVIVISFHQ